MKKKRTSRVQKTLKGNLETGIGSAVVGGLGGFSPAVAGYGTAYIGSKVGSKKKTRKTKKKR